MSEPMMKLQLIARSEMALAQINARRVASRSGLFSVALVFLLLGLAMATLASYLYLEPKLGAPLAALSVSMIDMVIGIIFILKARNAGPSENEEKLAKEIREMAYAELGSDIDKFKGELDSITSDVQRIRSGFSSFTSGAAGSLGPIVSMLFKVAKGK
ncbi:MAG: phage holin family protein [Gammaproteobacteria bacterium]|nr:phage holin family protein [Gammaproteobacteria bacterium]